GGRYNSAQVYQGLHWLAEQGWVVAAQPEPGLSRDRRPFSITAKGTREFDRWLRQPIVASRPLRDDAVIKLVFLCHHDSAHLIPFLERLRRQHLRQLAGVQARLTPPARSTVAELRLAAELSSAVLRFRGEAELRWIDYCLLRLRTETASPDAARVEPPSGQAEARRRP